METSRRGFVAVAVGAAVLWSIGCVVAGENAPATAQGDVVHLTLAVEGMH